MPTLLENENAGGHNRGVTAFFHDGRLRHVRCFDDLVGNAENFFFFIPTLVFIKFDAERRSQHGGGKVLGRVPGLLFRLAKCIILTEIPVRAWVRRDSASDGSSHQSPGFIGSGPGGNRECDHAGINIFDSLIPGNQFTIRRENTGDMNDIAFLNAGIAKSQLKRPQLVFVGPYAFGEKHFFWDQDLLAIRQMILQSIRPLPVLLRPAHPIEPPALFSEILLSSSIYVRSICLSRLC